MSVEAIVWAKRTRAGSANRKLLLLILADYADENWSCFPGQRLLADQTELGERTVRRILSEMETDGLFRREHRQRADGSRTSDRFILAGVEAEKAQDPTGQPRQPTGQPRQSNRPAVAGREPTGDPQVEPQGSPLPPAGQLALVSDHPPPVVRRDDSLTLVGFDAFWRVFPRKAGKLAAQQAWAKAVRRANAADIIAGAERYAADPNREDRFTKYPEGWLNAGMWADDPFPDRTPSPRAGTGGRMATGLNLLNERAQGATRALGAGS
ncbi:MAG TPA: helix-turn-helix domain-containing protein [Iamia sp.]|nr:helix-turn-helix domain-containing protein [Iamia sp.]